MVTDSPRGERAVSRAIKLPEMQWPFFKIQLHMIVLTSAFQLFCVAVKIPGPVIIGG